MGGGRRRARCGASEGSTQWQQRSGMGLRRWCVRRSNPWPWCTWHIHPSLHYIQVNQYAALAALVHAPPPPHTHSHTHSHTLTHTHTHARAQILTVASTPAHDFPSPTSERPMLRMSSAPTEKQSKNADGRLGRPNSSYAIRPMAPLSGLKDRSRTCKAAAGARTSGASRPRPRAQPQAPRRQEQHRYRHRPRRCAHSRVPAPRAPRPAPHLPQKVARRRADLEPYGIHKPQAAVQVLLVQALLVVHQHHVPDLAQRPQRQVAHALRAAHERQGRAAAAALRGMGSGGARAAKEGASAARRGRRSASPARCEAHAGPEPPRPAND
jgi:hypothetical protein